MDLEGWEKRETVLGEVFIRGMEIHLNPGITGKASRPGFREVFGPLLAKYGMVTTRVPHGMDDTFTRRIGFEFTWADAHFNYYALNEVPFSRKETRCQQQQ